MPRFAVICCLGLGACARATTNEPVAEPTLATFEPDETHEHELAHPTPDTTPSPPVRPKIEARWSDVKDPDVDCLFDPSVPACGPLLPAEAIREVVRGEIPAFRACWTDMDDVPPGPLDLRFTISRDGSVTDIHLREDLPPEFGGCLRRVIGSMQFPELARDGSVVVSYPWH